MAKSYLKFGKGSVDLVLIYTLSFIMVFLGITMVLVILNPYFTKQFSVPIHSVACLPDVHPIQPLKTQENTTKLIECYRVEDVLALNKALNMSDTIALLGVLLAVFAFISPIFNYLNLKKDKKDLKNLIHSEIDNANKKLNESSEGLINKIQESFNRYPKIISSLEIFILKYEIDKIEANYINLEDEDVDINLHFSRFNRDANEIAARLMGLMDTSSNINVLVDIDNYIREPDVLENKKYIKALKNVLRQIYNAGYFGSDVRKEWLSVFLHETLKTTEENFLIDTNNCS